MAKTYTEVCPHAELLILDSASSIGGVWAKERLYPGLKTNNLIGSYEFGDFPMHSEQYGMKSGQHIPGAVVHEYLSRFAIHFNLWSRLRLEKRVESAELRKDGEWLLSISSTGAGSDLSEWSVVTKRLVIATGLTSEPFVPQFSGQKTFQRNILHSRELKSRAKDIEAANDVVVLGGNKSAWDACYSAAMAGAHVSMVMRPSGGGPSWVWPRFFTPFKFSIQRLATTRFFTWFDPCIWGDADGFCWIRYLLHRTWFGRKIVSMFWKLLGYIVWRANGYNEHPELRKLKPWTSTFWMGNSLGIHNYDSNWFDFVKKGRISIHIADVVSLSEDTVNLSDGTELAADTLVCCTGWKVIPPIKFFPEHLAFDLGFPAHDRDDGDLNGSAKNQILDERPALQRGPKRSLPISPDPTNLESKKIEGHLTPYRLYRFLVPFERRFLEQRNFAMIGAHLAINATMVAQAQALWITAFFQDEIEHLKPSRISHDTVRRDTILHSEFGKLRHPPEAGGAGQRCPDLVFDGLPYIDLILKDIGANRFRKGGGWREVFDRYMPGDYKDLVKEWKEQHAAAGDADQRGLPK